MGRSALTMRAHGLGQGPFRFVALAILMSASGRGAAPLSARRLEIQARATTLQCDFTARRVKPRKALVHLPPQPLCQVTGSGRVESKSAPETFVDLTPAALAKEVHELKRLDSADSQDVLPMILARVGAAVADFFDNFSNTTCTERINSTVDTALGRLPLHFDGKLNYVALVRPGARKTSLQEFRTNSKGEVAEPKGAVITAGFVSLAVHFHPVFQRDSRFRYLGRELVRGQNTYVVAFAQRPGVARQAVAVKYSGKAGFVLLQGVAWIDPASFRIVRLRTELQQPEPNLGLQRETTEVEYSEVAFKRDGKRLWLPREVTVSGELKGFAFSNQHRYSQYRLFIVEADENREEP